MKLLAKCPVCKKRKLFIRQWWYKSFTGDIHDKQENPKCYACYKILKQTILNMGPIKKRTQNTTGAIENCRKH